MAAQGGYGLTMTLDAAAVVGIREADFPAIMKYIAESTAHDSSQGYYEATATGKRRVEPFQMTLIWDNSEASHAAVVTALGADSANAIVMGDPDGDESIAFSAHIERIGRQSRQEETYIATVDVHPTGPATIT